MARKLVVAWKQIFKLYHIKNWKFMLRLLLIFGNQSIVVKNTLDVAFIFT